MNARKSRVFGWPTLRTEYSDWDLEYDMFWVCLGERLAVDEEKCCESNATRFEGVVECGHWRGEERKEVEEEREWEE